MKHYVHRYQVIRVKVEVDAPNHLKAMEEADKLLETATITFGWASSEGVLEVEHAEEVTGYLVDEEGDEHFENTKTYGPMCEPDEPSPEAAEYRQTLDGAVEWFKDQPCMERARNLKKVAKQYLEDEMIGVETYEAAIEPTRDYLI